LKTKAGTSFGQFLQGHNERVMIDSIKKPVPHVKLLKQPKCQPITNPMKKPYRAKPVKLNL